MNIIEDSAGGSAPEDLEYRFKSKPLADDNIAFTMVETLDK